MIYSVPEKLKIKNFYSFFCSTYNENYFFSGEHHSCWEVVYCVNGTVGVSSDEKIYRLRDGDIIVYPPNVHHKLWAEGEREIKVLIFSFDASGEQLSKIAGAYSCDQELCGLIGRLVDEIVGYPQHYRTRAYLNWLSNDPNRFQRVANDCENILLSLVDHGLPLGSNKSKSAVDYERIIRAMRQNITKDLKVEELGKICNISVAAMKKLFCRFNSMGIHEYFLHLKMDEAVCLLQDGRSVMEVAEYLGFKNSAYFSTAFKRVMNETPGKFKKK